MPTGREPRGPAFRSPDRRPHTRLCERDRRALQLYAAHEILAALRWARLPQTWVEIALLMIRAIFTLFEQAGSVLAAQKVRLGHATLRRSLGSIGSLAGIVLLRSLDQSQRTHEAMTVRGYQGSVPLPRLRPLSRRDWAACSAGVATIAIVFFLLERLPL